MAWSVDDKQTRQAKRCREDRSDILGLVLQFLERHERGTNLLCDTTSFVALHVGVANLVQNLGLALSSVRKRRSVLAMSRSDAARGKRISEIHQGKLNTV